LRGVTILESAVLGSEKRFLTTDCTDFVDKEDGLNWRKQSTKGLHESTDRPQGGFKTSMNFGEAIEPPLPLRPPVQLGFEDEREDEDLQKWHQIRFFSRYFAFIGKPSAARRFMPEREAALVIPK
jgi:hypothetical protein